MGFARGIKWTDKLIEEKLFEVINYYKLDRMPTRNEIRNYYKNDALVVKLSRLGFYNIAQKYNLVIKNSDTQLGKENERYIKQLLEGKGFFVEQMSQNFPYDLLINEKVKIDVKASNLYKGKNGNFYTFSHNKKNFTCDFYVFVCLDFNKITDKIYIVPAYLFGKNTQFSIGEKSSKYHMFFQRFDLINVFLEHLNNLKEII